LQTRQRVEGDAPEVLCGRAIPVSPTTSHACQIVSASPLLDAPRSRSTECLGIGFHARGGFRNRALSIAVGSTPATTCRRSARSFAVAPEIRSCPVAALEGTSATKASTQPARQARTRTAPV
jgi:hypothetical protein